MWGCGLNFYVVVVVLKCGYDAMQSHKHRSGTYCLHLCCRSEKTKCFWMLATICQATWWHDHEDPNMKLCVITCFRVGFWSGLLWTWLVDFESHYVSHWWSYLKTSVVKTECCLRAVLFRYTSIVTVSFIAKDIFLNITCMYYTLFGWVIFKNFFFPWCNRPYSGLGCLVVDA